MRCLNVVGTRCMDGDHAALVHWYADHVHQLFGFEGLLEARLARCREAIAGPCPDWLCIYEFADRAAFEAYERSAVKAAAAAERALGWGRDGIAISFRSAFERIYRRRDEVAAPQPPLITLGPVPDARAAAAACAGSLELLRPADAGPLWLTQHAPATAPTAAPPAEWSGRYEWRMHWQR